MRCTLFLCLGIVFLFYYVRCHNLNWHKVVRSLFTRAERRTSDDHIILIILLDLVVSDWSYDATDKCKWGFRFSIQFHNNWLSDVTNCHGIGTRLLIFSTSSALPNSPKQQQSHWRCWRPHLWQPLTHGTAQEFGKRRSRAVGKSGRHFLAPCSRRSKIRQPFVWEEQSRRRWLGALFPPPCCR